MIRKINSKKITLPPSDAHSQTLNNINERLHIALNSWKKKLPFSRRCRLKKLPWFLIMGAPGCGKTALLANSPYPLYSDQTSQISPGKPTQQLQCWSHKETLLLEVPGAWYSAATGSTDEQCLHHVLKCIHAYRKPTAPTHTLIVLNCEQLTSQNPHDRQKEQARITGQLQFMHDWNPSAELTILLNKADKIPGFTEFFSHLKQTDREKTCGIGLKVDSSKPVMDALSTQLSAFSERIKLQTINRMHHERNIQTRDAIMSFPHQIECLMQSLTQLLEATPVRVLPQLKGIYLTSCEQDDAHQYKKETIRTGTNKQNTTYFIKDLFSSLLTPAKEKIVQQKLLWRGEYTQLALAILLLAGATVGLHIGFVNSKDALSNVSETLNADPSPISKKLPAWLNNMNQLEAARQVLLDQNHFNGDALGLRTVGQLTRHVTDYRNMLAEKKLKTWIFNTLTDQLKREINDNSPQLFYDLATYLRLTRDHPLPAKILPWFNRHWSGEFPDQPKLVSLLISNLKQLLEDKTTHWSPNKTLIKNAKQVLMKSPPAQIVFMMLTTEHSQEKQAIDTDQPSLLSSPLLTINPLYLPSRFTNITSDEIPLLAEKLTEDNWVLGQPIFKTLQPQKTTRLIAAAKQLYVESFSSHWLDALKHLNISQSNNLEKDHQIFQYLSKPDSKLMKTILSVSQLMLKQSELSLYQKKQWLGIKNALLVPKNSQLLVAAFQEAALYTQKILYANNPEKAAFLTAQIRMKKNPDSNPLAILNALAGIMPKPFSTWLTESSQKTWKHVLESASTYINTAWATGIYAKYTDTIMNRYPIFSSAQQDISITDFNQFFGIGGAVQHFYSNYLADFVDTQKAYWTFKKLDGEQLPINRAGLDAIIRGSLIQKMFYQNDKNNPLIGFQLFPKKLSPSVQQFTLNISGQVYTIVKNGFQNFQGTWPGPDSQFVTMRFVTRSGTTPSLSKNGPWAWLRLLQEEQLTPTSDPKKFTLIYGIGKNKATFELIADNKINPYLPGLLDGLRLPALLSTIQPTEQIDKP